MDENLKRAEEKFLDPPGEHLLKCPFCDGSGKFATDVECMACEGYGEAPAERLAKFDEVGAKSNCDLCHGEGYWKSNTAEYEGRCPRCSHG